MNIIRQVVPPLNVNCYIVADEKTKNCILFDVGGGFDKVKELTDSLGYKIVGAAFTHGHYDHALDGQKVKDSGIPVYVTRKDEELLQGRGNLARYCGVKMQPFAATEYLAEGDYEIGEFKFKVLYTPGHTAGSCCFSFGDFLLCGDTLFKGNYGRCDFPSGSLDDMKKSVFDKLFTLPENTVLYPGHGEPTTVGDEIKDNPINDYKDRF